MATDQNSVAGQVDNLNSKLADYFSKMQKYVADPNGGQPLPDFATFVESFDFSELHRMTISRASDAASYENGAAIENTHHMIAVAREFNLRTKTKASYYSDAQADFTTESDYYATMKVFWGNMLRGVYEEGKIS